MKKILVLGALLAAALGVCGRAGAQAALYTGEVRTTAGAVAPGATVTVCPYSGTQYVAGIYTGPVPCSPASTIYNEPTLTVQEANPMATDQLGEYTFYATTGTYTITVQGPGLVSRGFAAQLGGVGGAGNPASPAASVQLANAGVNGFSAVSGLGVDSLTSPTTLEIPLSTATKGPSPSVDVTEYGARSTLTTISATNVGCTSGSGTLTGAPTSLKNGDGIVAYGCGASVSLSAPAAPTATTGAAEGPETWDMPIAALAGASSYSYLVVERDAAGGLSPAGTPVALSTGPTALGLQSCAITSGTLSGSTLTLTPTSACAVPVGAAVGYVGGTAFADTYSNVTAAGSTISIAMNLSSVYQTTTTTTGGTLYWWWANHLSLPALESGATKYYVCAERPGDGSYRVVWTGTSATWDDYGWNEGGFPQNVSNSICTAGTAAPDPLSGTVASGGGTATIALAGGVTAAQTTSTATLYKDDEPGIAAACAAATAAKSSIFIPPGTFNSYMPFTMGCTVLQKGTLQVFDTIALSSTYNWTGEGQSVPQFTQRPAAMVVCNGDPCLAISSVNNGEDVRGLFFSIPANSEGVLITGELNGEMEYDSFSTGGSTDYGGVGLHVTGQGYGYKFEHLTFDCGPGQAGGGFDFASTAPEMWFDAPGSNVQTVDDINFNARAMVYFESTNASEGEIAEACNIYNQGGIMPNLVFENASNGFEFKPTICGKWIQDTSSQADLAYLSATGTFYGPANVSATLGTNGSPVTGAPFAYTFQKTDAPVMNAVGHSETTLYANDPVDAGNGPNLRSYSKFSGPAIYRSGAYVALAAPVLSAPTLSAGGSVPTGSQTYSIYPIDWGNGWGTPSNSQTISVTSGNQTVNLSWTAVLGAAGYQIERSGGFVTAGSGPASGVTCVAGTCSYTDTAAFNVGWPDKTPRAPGAAGLEGFSSAFQGVFAPRLLLSSSDKQPFEADFSGIYTAVHHDTVPDATGTLALHSGTWSPGSCEQETSTVGLLQAGGMNCTPTGGEVPYTASQTLTASNANQMANFNCASACTATLPNPPPSAVYSVAVSAVVGGAAVSISPNGLNLTICGSTSTGSFAIPVQGESIYVTTDGTNYFATCPVIPGANVTMTPGAGGISVAASLAGGGTAIQGTPSDVTGQSSSQAAVTIGSSLAAGRYVVRLYADQNAVCTTGSNSVSFTINWTDGSAARSLQTGSLALGSAQLASGYLSGTFPIQVAAGTNVSYTSTVQGSCGSGTSSYDAHLSLTN